MRSVALSALSLGILVLAATARSGAQEPSRARLAFVRNGEVWMSERDGRRAAQVTRTGGKVEEFRVAPAQAYLAYARTVRYVDEPGLFDANEKSPKRSVQSIAIMSLTTGRLITELQPGDEWIYLNKWLPGGRLLGHSASGFDVTGVFELDVATHGRRELGLEAGGRLMEGDIARDGSVMAYVDDSGLGPTYQERLHVVDRGSGTDVIRAGTRSIIGPRIANGKSAVAFVEVTDGAGSPRDRVWIVGVRAGDPRMVYEDVVRPKSWGVDGLSWSPDDRYLAMNYDGVAIIIDTTGEGSRPVQTRGTDACWMGARELVMVGQAGIDTYDVASGARRLLIPKASAPQCLGFEK